MNIQDIQVFIKNAIANNACEAEIDVLSNLTSIDDVLNHPKIAEWAYWYARFVIKGRWPEAEDVIKTSPEWAAWYARLVIKDRWPEGEDVIKTNHRWAYWYAKNVIKGRWPEAEDVIKTSPGWAHWYARLVIKDRWSEVEDIIKTRDLIWYTENSIL